METLRNLTYAIAAAGAIAFCAPGARAGNFTTNYDVLNITGIVQTNIEVNSASETDSSIIHAFTLNNAAILGLFEGPDWYNGTFPAGSKLVVSWDAGENVAMANTGDILVVDKTGTNVLYDASGEIWSASGAAFMTIDFYQETGACEKNYNPNDPGHYDFIWFNNAKVQILDTVSSDRVSITTTGPSTEISTQAWNASGDFTSWSDSEHASTSGAGQQIDGYNDATVSLQISTSGHGPGEGGWFFAQYY